MMPRTAIRDEVLRNVTPGHDAAVVEAIEQTALEATEAACLSNGPLLDFEEFAQVRSGALRRDVAAEQENIA
jgi:hypothetical protein